MYSSNCNYHHDTIWPIIQLFHRPNNLIQSIHIYPNADHKQQTVDCFLRKTVKIKNKKNTLWVFLCTWSVPSVVYSFSASSGERRRGWDGRQWMQWGKCRRMKRDRSCKMWQWWRRKILHRVRMPWKLRRRLWKLRLKLSLLIHCLAMLLPLIDLRTTREKSFKISNEYAQQVLSVDHQNSSNVGVVIEMVWFNV